MSLPQYPSQPAMSSISLDSIYQFKPPRSKNKPFKQRPATWGFDASTVSQKFDIPAVPTPNITMNTALKNQDPSEPFEPTLSPFCDLTLEAFGNDQDTNTAGLPLTVIDKENKDPLFSVEELLSYTAKTPDLQVAEASVEHGRGNAVDIDDRSFTNNFIKPPAPGTERAIELVEANKAVADVGSSINEETQQGGRFKEAVDATNMKGRRETSKRTARKATLDEMDISRVGCERVEDTAGCTKETIINDLNDPTGDRTAYPPTQKGQKHPTRRPSRDTFKDPFRQLTLLGENAVKSSPRREIGKTQEDPVRLDDDGLEVESDAVVTAIPDIGTVSPSIHPQQEPKTLGCFETSSSPPPRSFGCPSPPNSPKLRRPNRSAIHEDARQADLTTNYCDALSSPALQRCDAQILSLEETEWEIKKIVDKRQAGNGYEYRVRWEDTWVPKSELGNARQMLKEFEAPIRKHGSKRSGCALTNTRNARNIKSAR